MTDIPPRLHLRSVYGDGRVNTLITWQDGHWKVEIFASREHAEKFAEENKMQVVDHTEE